VSSDRTGLQRWCLTIVAALVSLAAIAWIAPHVPLPPLAAYVFGFSCIVASTLAVASQLPLVKARSMAPGFVLGLCVLACLRAWPLHGLPGALLVAGTLLVLGSAVGGVVGSAIEHPGHLLFVALVSALVDVLSVAHPAGPSAAIASSPQMLSLLAVSWPMLGSDRIEPMLGVGDVVFAVLYATASRAHALSVRRTLLALAAAFLLTMLAVIALELPVPALPFLGLAMVAAHAEVRRPRIEDRRRGFSVVCGLSVVVVVLLARRFF
jgi:hypothetical protein